MYSKMMFAAAAVVAQAAAYSNSTSGGNYTLPACWSSCFAKYQVDSENCLCSDSLDSVVSSCIDAGCSAASSKAYEDWVYSYCNKGPATSTVTVETTSYTTVCPVTETSTSGSVTVTSSYSTTSTIVTTQSKTVPVTSATPTSYATIVTSTIETSTSVVPTTTTYTVSSGSATSTWTSTWESTTTITSSYITTKTPGWNTWTVTPSSIPSQSVGGSAGSTATGTGSWSKPSSPAPYTGGAANLKAAGALIGAGAFAALLL